MAKFKVCMGLYGLNADRLLGEAIETVLGQDFDGVEVVLSDDGSTDRTYDIMEEYAKRGTAARPVRVNRHPQKQGIGGQLNSICALSSAEVIVLCGADDRSLPHRARRTYETWIESGRRAHSITSSAFIIDEMGKRTGSVLPGHLPAGNLVEQIRGRFGGVYGAAQAMSRRSWEMFGPFMPRLLLEDNSIAMRAMLLDGFAHVDEPLVEYRVHTTNSCRLPEQGVDLEKFMRQCRWYHHASALVYAQFLSDLYAPAAEVVDGATLDEARRVAADLAGRELLLAQHYSGTIKGSVCRHARSLLARVCDLLKVSAKSRLPFIDRINAKRAILRRQAAPY